jgi:hypothetical protein
MALHIHTFFACYIHHVYQFHHFNGVLLFTHLPTDLYNPRLLYLWKNNNFEYMYEFEKAKR